MDSRNSRKARVWIAGYLRQKLEAGFRHQLDKGINIGKA